MERFTSFEGNTGPYILYTIVRIKSLFAKSKELGYVVDMDTPFKPSQSQSETDVMLSLCKWQDTVYTAYEEQAPHKICQFIYELSDAFNKFYHENRIVNNEDEGTRNSYIKLSCLVGNILETATGLLGIETPERM